MRFIRNSRFGNFYGCSRYPVCQNTHGAHPDGTPLGKPANKATREARIGLFDIAQCERLIALVEEHLAEERRCDGPELEGKRG